MNDIQLLRVILALEVSMGRMKYSEAEFIHNLLGTQPIQKGLDEITVQLLGARELYRKQYPSYEPQPGGTNGKCDFT